MDSLKGKIRSQMEVMEAELRKPQLLRRSLARKLGNAETDWDKVEDYYMHILTLITEQEAEDGRLAHEQFQTQYLTLIGRVQDSLDKLREEEEAQERENVKVSNGGDGGGTSKGTNITRAAVTSQEAWTRRN